MVERVVNNEERWLCLFIEHVRNHCKRTRWGLFMSRYSLIYSVNGACNKRRNHVDYRLLDSTA